MKKRSITIIMSGAMPRRIARERFRLLGAVIVGLGLAIAGSVRLQALPRFTLLSGTRCSACHFNPQGSGIRNELGWSTMNRVGMFNPDSIGLGALYANETNTFFDGMVTLGFDGRLQVAKLGSTADAPRKVIPMQVAPSLAFMPFEELVVYGTYNAGPLRYPGQTSFDAAIQYQPGVTLPGIRAGYIQPSIGIRHDDHTMFIRRDAAGFGTPLIPPNYNEIGAEVTYEGLRWLTLNAGVFASHNIARKAELFLDSARPNYSARVILWPQLLDEGLNGMVGGSFYGNQEFRLMNAFVGIGLSDKATIYGEGSYMNNADGKIIRNLMMQGSYQLAQWLALEWRYEWGLSEHPDTGPFYAQSFVVGTQFFPLPYMEIRPEYRYVHNKDYQAGQYTVQLHLFY